MRSDLRIAVTGSAGVGKTTLARALSERLGLALVPEEMRAYRSRGGEALRALPSEAGARTLAALYAVRRDRERREGFVADNCALDFAAYAVHHGCAAAASATRAEAEADALRYDAIFVLPWGVIPYERDGVRGDDHEAEERYQLVLEALLARSGAPTVHVPREAIDLGARIDFCLETLRARRARPGGGFVSLVGAGPGDPALLTLRAAELLAQAEVVAHDALVAPAILARVRPGAELIAVGHRVGDGSRIHRLHPAVLGRAKAGRHVVRLKQGDPFLFGRGAEEAEELIAAGVPFEVVPGVTAALGACAYAGIPLTHREHASNVVFASGHDLLKPTSRTDWTRLAVGASTLVLYMASRSLAESLARIVANGRSAETPAAAIVAGTTLAQRVVVGTLGDLAEKMPPLAPSGPPALVVVGEVVRMREQIDWWAKSRMASDP